MERGTKAATTKVGAVPSVARKSRKIDSSSRGEVEQRLTEALEQQRATSEILRAISRSQTDARPVFETIAAAALKLCSASSATVTTFDGELIHIVALAVVNPEARMPYASFSPDRLAATSRPPAPS